MRRTAAVLAAAVVLALPAAPARAKPSDPFVLRASGGRQTGALLHFTETRQDGRGCVGRHADGIGEQSSAVTHDGSELVWRLRDARRPLAVTLYRTRWVARGVKVNVERTDELDARLRPVRSGRRVVAWEVVSEPVGRRRHGYRRVGALAGRVRRGLGGVPVPRPRDLSR